MKGIEFEQTVTDLPEKKSKKLYLLPDHNLEPIFTAPPILTAWQPEYEHLSEDDIVNMALFGVTQEQFTLQYPTAKGTVHNNSAISHIITHNALQKRNTELIAAGIPKESRFIELNRMAMEQTVSLVKKANRLLMDSVHDEDESPMLDEGSAG